MILSGSKRFELWFWSVLPGLCTLGLAVFFLVSKHLSVLTQVMPMLPAIPVFYWGMREAHEMPYWFVFFLGLAMDAVMGLPLGMSSLLYLLILALVCRQRRHINKEGFIAKWGAFAGLLGATSLLSWLTIGFVGGRLEGLLPALVQWLLTVCCYPLLHKLFDIMYDHIHARRWQIMHGH